jgi:ParB family chromosome partitioning protein
MVNSRGLGKGFGSLLPTDFDESILLDKQDRVQKLLVQDIQPDPNQPRKTFDQTSIQELAASIKQYGILQPLVVVRSGEGYVIVAGERRYHAAQQVGLTHVPALVRTLEELERLEIGLIENMQRVDLSPLEQAVSIVRLHEQFNVAYQDIAQRLGKAHTTVVNIVRLLQLPEFARLMLEQGKISEGHARSLLALKGNELAQKNLLHHIVDDGWSVRQAEAFVKVQKVHKQTQIAKEKRKANPAYDKYSRSLSKQYGAGVKIKEAKKGGTVQFSFTSHKKLVQFVEGISKEDSLNN